MWHWINVNDQFHVLAALTRYKDILISIKLEGDFALEQVLTI